MNIDIKFRGKCVCTGEWKYGYYKKGKYCSYITVLTRFLFEDDPHARKYGTRWIDYEVDEETVCQYTGLKDLNKQDIYEGDIIVYRQLIVKNLKQDYNEIQKIVPKITDFNEFWTIYCLWTCDNIRIIGDKYER